MQISTPSPFSQLIALAIRGSAFGVAIAVFLSSTGCSLVGHKNNETQPSAEPGMAVIGWQALAGLRGCNIYRVNANGTQVQVNDKPVEPLAPAADGQPLEEYRFIDNRVIAGRDYYYIAEGIGDSGSTVLWEQPRMITAIPLSETQTF